MIWLLTIPLALIALYALLNLMIDTGKGSSSRIPYLILLVVSTAVVYVAWFHPIRITFA